MREGAPSPHRDGAGRGLWDVGRIILAHVVADALARPDGARVIEAGLDPDARAIPHGARIIEAGLDPVAGVILDGARVESAGVFPNTGVLPDVRQHRGWEQHQPQHHSNRKYACNGVCFPHDWSSFCGLKVSALLGTRLKQGSHTTSCKAETRRSWSQKRSNSQGERLVDGVLRWLEGRVKVSASSRYGAM